MKIVQVVRELHAKGGSSAVAWHLREQFTAKGIENEVITQRSEPRAPAPRSFEKIRHIFDVISFTYSATIRLKKIKQKGLVVIVHNEALGGDIYVDHGLHKAVVLAKLSIMVRNPIHLFLFVREEIRHSFRTYKKVVCLSRISRDIFQIYYPKVDEELITTIPNGVDLQRFRPMARSNTLYFTALFVGHEFERKGLRYAIEAMALLPKDVKLVVIGGGKGEIRQFSEFAAEVGVLDRIEFLGRRYDVPDIMAGSDIMVLPASYESWALVVVEALACGLPVIMTKVGCAEEVIVEGQTGYISSREPASIADRISQMRTNIERSPAVREACVSMASNYDWSSVADRYIDLARQVLEERQ